MKGIFGISTYSILGLAAVLMLLAGAFGPWLDFPLSAPIFAGDLSIPWPITAPETFKNLLLVIALTAAIGWLSGLRLLSLLAAVAAIAALALFFHSWLTHEQWLSGFLSESEQRLALQDFLNHYYWPNNNPEPTTVLESEFEYLSGQALIFWYATGWGWGFFVLGLVLLLFEHLFSTPMTGLSTLALVLVSGILATPILFPLLNAELNHRRADALLGAGQAREAVALYEYALSLNPALSQSDRFLSKASRAFYQLEGDESLLAALYQASTRDKWVTGRPLSPPARDHLERSSLVLQDVIRIDYHGSRLQQAILRQSIRDYIRVLIMLGLDAYTRGESSVSMVLFQRALHYAKDQLHAGFFLAHVQHELGLHQEAISTLEGKLDLVFHDSMRADLLCTIGDAHSQAHRPLQAREAYTKCLESDSLFNFRAVLNLGGT